MFGLFGKGDKQEQQEKKQYKVLRYPPHRTIDGIVYYGTDMKKHYDRGTPVCDPEEFFCDAYNRSQAVTAGTSGGYLVVEVIEV